MNETEALKRRRDVTKARTSRAEREALAPKPPTAAINAFVSTMDTYAARVSTLVEKLVIGKLPIVGSGDPLDRAALDRGLAELQTALDQLAQKARAPAGTAAKRVLEQSRREAARVLKLDVPPSPEREKLAIHDFQKQVVGRLHAAGQAQVARIRKAIAEYEEGASMRKDILDQLWVSRNRGRFIARDECYGLATDTLKMWAQRMGSEEYQWVTCKDDRVRPGHAALDGTTQRWSSPPNTGHGEGNNHPGQAPNCRCRALPVEVLP